MARVLLIEPNRSLRTFIAGILADLGHDVQQCRNLGDSRDLLTRAAFDVVATDLVLDKKAAPVDPGAVDLRILTLSGEAFAPSLDAYDRAGPLNERPFRLDHLQNLASAVASPPLAA